MPLRQCRFPLTLRGTKSGLADLLGLGSVNIGAIMVRIRFWDVLGPIIL